MTSRDLLALAARYTLDWRGGYLSGVLSLLSMLGLVLAIALLILVLSVMNGFDREMRDNILATVPQLTVRAWEPMQQWHDAAAVIGRHPEVKSVTPFVELQGMFVHGSSVETTLLFGVPADSDLATQRLSRVALGQGWSAFRGDSGGLLLGSELATTLGLEAGDGVTLIVPDAGLESRRARFQHLRLSGVVHTGTELDQSAAFLHLETAAGLAGRPGEVDGYRLQLEDLFQAPRVGWELINQLPPSFYVRDWTTTHGNLYAAIQMSKGLVGVLLLSVIAIAAFNVVSSLVLVVVDKGPDIAILRAMGASPGDINGIFIRQGLLIAGVGIVLGTGLGVLGSLWVTEAVRGLELLLGFRFLNTDVYPIGYMPSDLRWGDILRINGVALFLCFLASLYPARRAGGLPPAEALRHD